MQKDQVAYWYANNLPAPRTGGGKREYPTIKFMTSTEKKIRQQGWTSRGYKEVRRKITKLALQDDNPSGYSLKVKQPTRAKRPTR